MTMSTRLYVGTYPLRQMPLICESFSDTGTVEDAVIVTRPGTSRPRGFGDSSQ